MENCEAVSHSVGLFVKNQQSFLGWIWPRGPGHSHADTSCEEPCIFFFGGGELVKKKKQQQQRQQQRNEPAGMSHRHSQSGGRLQLSSRKQTHSSKDPPPNIFSHPVNLYGVKKKKKKKSDGRPRENMVAGRRPSE